MLPAPACPMAVVHWSTWMFDEAVGRLTSASCDTNLPARVFANRAFAGVVKRSSLTASAHEGVGYIVSAEVEVRETQTTGTHARPSLLTTTPHTTKAGRRVRQTTQNKRPCCVVVRCCVVLCCVVLCCVVLCCVALCCVVLRCVALRRVVLCCVVLCCVVLCCVVLQCSAV